MTQSQRNNQNREGDQAGGVHDATDNAIPEPVSTEMAK
jgi:hypothetical protein